MEMLLSNVRRAEMRLVAIWFEFTLDKSRQQWLPAGKDAESKEAQEHANSSSLALFA
jgi:hypothetical protein